MLCRILKFKLLPSRLHSPSRRFLSSTNIVTFDDSPIIQSDLNDPFFLYHPPGNANITNTKEFYRWTVRDQNHFKSDCTQVLSWDELKHPYYINKYNDGQLKNFDLNQNDVSHIGSSTMCLNALYNKAQTNAGSRLVQSLVNHSGYHLGKPIAFGSTAFFAKSDPATQKSRGLITSAHSVSPFIDADSNPIYDANDPNIAAEISQIQLLTSEGHFCSTADVKHIDIENDIAVIQSDTFSSTSLLQIGDYTENHHTECVLAAGYRAQAMNSQKEEQVVIGVYGLIGDLSFCSVRQSYVDNNEHNAVIDDEHIVSYLNSERKRLKIFNYITKGFSGGPLVINGVVCAVIVCVKEEGPYNEASIITEDAKRMIAIIAKSE